MKKPKFKWLTPLLFVIITFTPMVAAWIVFENQLWPQQTTNHGSLLKATPIKQLAAYNSDFATKMENLAGKWWIVYIIDNHCDDLCQQNLHHLRQTNIALGKESDRVSRLVININSSISIEQLQAYQPLTIINISKDSINNFFATNIPTLATTFNKNVYLLDPMGNLFMSYPLPLAGKGILLDLNHLLKYSQVG